MRYTGPRNRIARRENLDLGLKTVGSKSHGRLLKKLNVPPGQHGLRSRRKISGHALQLREKQKLRYLFGITDKQLKKYFKIAIRQKGNTASHMAKLLEGRLDNIIYRLGFAPTRASARQLVTHGHVKIGEKRVSIPSYQVKVGDVMSFVNEKTGKIPYIETSLSNKDAIMPEWLSKEAIQGKLVKSSDSSVIDKQINLRLVIEFYSR